MLAELNSGLPTLNSSEQQTLFRNIEVLLTVNLTFSRIRLIQPYCSYRDSSFYRHDHGLHMGENEQHQVAPRRPLPRFSLGLGSRAFTERSYRCRRDCFTYLVPGKSC